MILPLIITIILEGAFISVYAVKRKKPIKQLLVSDILINILTQFLLWGMLTKFPDHYVPVLLGAEAGIFLLEGGLLYLYPYNRLRLVEALLLSFVLNLISFSFGLLLPV